VQEILSRIERSITTYGLNKQADIQAHSLEHKHGGISFDVNYMKYKMGKLHLKIPGEHNVLNALAAIAVGLELDIPFEKIKAGLEKFSGVDRRFEHKAEVNDIMIVDDYAHHPTEVTATLKAARSGWPKRRILAVFQPHLYSRTRDFYMDFARSFLQVDILIITDIYPAREKPIPGVDGKLIADTAQSLGHRDVHYVADKNELPAYVANISKTGDMVITLGAGDIWKYGEFLAEELEIQSKKKQKKNK
jgi:UDP-N-acetylmuramate--alanine ligase